MATFWMAGRVIASAGVLIYLGCGGSGGTQPAGKLDFDFPQDGVWTNGILQVALRSTGALPDSVVLDVDGAVTQTLPPPFRTTIDTRALTEGSHLLHASGTSDGGTFSSAQRQFNVDRTPPRLVSQTPAPGGSVESAASPVILTFDEPLLPITLDGGAFLLRQSGASVPLTPSLSQGGQILTLTPGTVPVTPKPARVELQVQRGFATDRAGNPAPGISDGWIVPFWFALGGPISVHPGTVAFEFPVLGVAPDDAPLVGLNQFWDVGYQGWVERWDSGRWDPLGGPDASVPRLAGENTATIYALTIQDGQPVVAFISSTAQTSTPRVARWSGTAWERLGDTVTDPALTPTFMSMATDPTGHPWALVGTDRSDGFLDWYVSRWDGAAWIPVGGLVNDNPGWIAPGMVQMSDAGVAFVVLSEKRISSAGIYVRTFDGGTWPRFGGEVAWNGDSASGTTLPSIGFDADDQPVVLMDQHTNFGWGTFVFRWSGGSWNPLGDQVGSPQPDGEILTSGGISVSPTGMISVALVRSDGGVRTAQLQEFTDAGWTPRGEPLVASAPTEWSKGWGAVRLTRDSKGRRVLLLVGCTGGICDPYVFRENL